MPRKRRFAVVSEPGGNWSVIDRTLPRENGGQHFAVLEVFPDDLVEETTGLYDPRKMARICADALEAAYREKGTR